MFSHLFVQCTGLQLQQQSSTARLHLEIRRASSRCDCPLIVIVGSASTMSDTN